MYVVGSVRSGSTAFAVAKALEYNIPYAGDLSHSSIHQPGAEPFRVNAKNEFHEIGFNPSYTVSQYVEISRNLQDPAHMYLLPTSMISPGSWGNAVGYITRRNIKDIARSLFCYVKKTTTSRLISEGEMYGYIERALIGAVCLLEYCKQTNKQITWYEDMFDVDTVYTAWEESPFKLTIEAKIDKLLQELNPQSINSNINLT
jgi:hypothetical protein